MVVDHSKDEQVEALFNKIKTENNGRLDILVNNAFAGVDVIFNPGNKRSKFYNLDPAEQWDALNGVGLRNHFMCTVYASRLMVKRTEGLIVNISSAGGIRYLFNAAYGIGKAACDRMAADCAIEFRESNITMVSLWPGPVKTEYVQDKLINAGENDVVFLAYSKRPAASKNQSFHYFKICPFGVFLALVFLKLKSWLFPQHRKEKFFIFVF